MKKIIDDLFIGAGCICLIAATAIGFGLVPAIYATGVILIVLGVLIGKGLAK